MYENISMILGEGNFVLAICDGSFDGKATAFFNLYRIQSDQIVEHWEIVEVISPEDQWKNNNGKTNFDY